MSKCTSIRKPNREVCIGDMIDPIELHTRTITTPNFETVDFDENFEAVDPTVPRVLSMIKTVKGKTYFDGVGEETIITHNIYITYNPLVTAETWVLFEDRRIDILFVEDLDERHDFMLLTCVDRGLVTKAASKA